jgi:hypothetical protein
MIRELYNSLHYGLYSEAALLIFLGVFAAVTIRTLLMDRRVTRSHADIVLSDQPQVPRHES